MLKLIKLEMKKVKMNGYIRSAVIANLVIMAMLALIIFGTKNEGDNTFTSLSFAFTIIDTFIRATFITFASILIARFIIDEYKNNTINLLFMYPVNRKKLMAAKLFIVASFTFISIILSNIFLDCSFCAANSIYSFIPDKLTSNLIINNFKNICFSSIASTGMSLIPIYFGMRKKSVPATITSGFLVACIVCSSFNGRTLNSIIAIPIFLAVIGIVIAYLSIRDIEHVDVAK